MTQEILSIISNQFGLFLLIASVTFLLGLIFEKQLSALYEKACQAHRQKEHEKRKQEYLAMKKREEADRRKVQKIRDNFNREMENTGRICVPYYAAS